jgi:hypothetical protein
MADGYALARCHHLLGVTARCGGWRRVKTGSTGRLGDGMVGFTERAADLGVQRAKRTLPGVWEGSTRRLAWPRARAASRGCPN